MSRRILPYAGIALLSLIAFYPRNASGWCRLTHPLTAPGFCEQGTVVSWSISCVGVQLNQRELRIADPAQQDFTELLPRHLEGALRSWSEVSCDETRGPALRFVTTPISEFPLSVEMDGRNVVSINRQWLPDVLHRPGTIAITILTADQPSATLLEADIELNAKAPENPLGREFGDGAPRWGVADLPTVLLHETGHLAGLWHSFERASVMYASMEVERQLRVPTDDDRSGLCASYPVVAERARPSLQCAAQTPRPRPGTCAATPSKRTLTTHGWLSLCVLGLLVRRRRETKRERAVY